MYPQLRRNLIKAQDETEKETGHMRILCDVEGKKLADKLYGKYLGVENMSKYPLFCYKLDKLLFDMGARQGEDGNAEKEDDDGNKKPLDKKKNKATNNEDEDEDEETEEPDNQNEFEDDEDSDESDDEE